MYARRVVGERSEYTPGTFCAVDLAAADVEQGKAFYAGLFGWDHGDPYRDWIACLLDGKIVAGIVSQPDDQREAGIPLELAQLRVGHRRGS